MLRLPSRLVRAAGICSVSPLDWSALRRLRRPVTTPRCRALPRPPSTNEIASEGRTGAASWRDQSPARTEVTWR
eukprot:5512616-Pyramimonas_sp.AAC.2